VRCARNRNTSACPHRPPSAAGRGTAGLAAHPIDIVSGPRLTIQGDSDQLEQLLINLLRNAVDAARETGGAVSVGWQRLPGASPPTMELWVEDQGPGISNMTATSRSPVIARSATTSLPFSAIGS
jgi:hypothetical protein